ncbi:cytochrome P450 monooxygenase [Penicillium antarcticum]|nr:cytochrome P450 monooxygenase [Penicillium antarcticum]KAJ5294678.1 cytochrome P450 monooxygenase [Penicillium antarcticum]
MSSSRRTTNTISATDRTVHEFKRRIMFQVFCDPGMRAIEDRFMAKITDFIALLWDKAKMGPKHLRRHERY